MNRTIGYIIPLIVIIMFAVLLNSGTVLKKPLTNNDDAIKQLQVIKQLVLAEKWSEAADETDELEKIWQSISRRSQFSVEKDGLLGFKKSIYRLKGYIDSKDTGGALAEIGEAKFNYDDLAQ